MFGYLVNLNSSYDATVVTQDQYLAFAKWTVAHGKTLESIQKYIVPNTNLTLGETYSFDNSSVVGSNYQKFLKSGSTATPADPAPAP